MSTPSSNSYCWATFVISQGEAVISRNKNHPAGVELLKLACCFSCVRWIDDENNLQLCQNLQQNYLVGESPFNIYFGFASRILSFF